MVTRLQARVETGHHLHIVADYQNGQILSLCGNLYDVVELIEWPVRNYTCARCRKSLKRYGLKKHYGSGS